MAVAKTFVSDMDPTRSGLALTWVVPSAACDLRCRFCYIKQRREAAEAVLRPQDYVEFLRDVAGTWPVRVSGLQGYEPLLDDSWVYTRAILAQSAALGIPTSMVTNGTHLAARVADLARLKLRDLTVSLDASMPGIHDRIRGVRGAFARTIDGIAGALRAPIFGPRLVVASVLLPGKRTYLDGVPSLLARLGVRHFGVTPLLAIRSGGQAQIVQEHDSLMQDLDMLDDECRRAGIAFVVDDELSQFRRLLDGANRLMIHSLERPDRLVRLTPSGACSVGVDVLSRVGPGTAVWRPACQPASTFLKAVGVGTDLDPGAREEKWTRAAA